MRLRPGTPPPHTLPHSTPSVPRSSTRSLLGDSVRPCCAVQKILKLYYAGSHAVARCRVSTATTMENAPCQDAFSIVVVVDRVHNSITDRWRGRLPAAEFQQGQAWRGCVWRTQSRGRRRRRQSCSWHRPRYSERRTPPARLPDASRPPTHLSMHSVNPLSLVVYTTATTEPILIYYQYLYVNAPEFSCHSCPQITLLAG